MRKEIIETGKTVDAAINTACEKLGCERDNCEWEIIDLPKKGFLGLKSFPAKVKVSIEVPDEKPAETKRPPVQPPAAQPVREQKAAPNLERRDPPKREPAAPSQPHRERRYTRDNEERPQRIRVTDGFTEKEILATSYIDSILKKFGLDAVLELSREGSGICVDITGEGLGSIIGRRGETLDAIQYLTGLVANRLEGDYMRVTVDCGDYRNKRRDTLESLAKKLASQVLKTNVSKTLEPMNPFERRVIHATVSQIEGVSSSSVGEEPNRRVVITSPTARRAPSRSFRDGDRRDSRPGDRRPPRDRDRGGFRGKSVDRNRDRDRDYDHRPSSPRPPAPPSAPADSPPKQTPESAVTQGTPYGKLDLE